MNERTDDISGELRKQLFELIDGQYNFRNADRGEIRRMTDCAVFGKYREGSYLFHEGEPVKYLFFILDGAVHLHCFRKDESLQRWANITGGNMISVYELYRWNRVHGESAHCLKDTVTAMIPVDDFFGKVLKLNTIAAAIIDYMAFIIEERTEELLCVTVLDKLSLYFKRQMVYFKRYETENGVIKLFRDHYYDQIAEITGCARETVNRELKKLEKAGKIRLTREHIIIEDPSLLV